MQTTTTDANIDRAAVISAAGFSVRVFKLQCSPRCAFEYEDTTATRTLVESFDLGQVADVPHKAAMYARAELLRECHDLKVGRIGGA